MDFGFLSDENEDYRNKAKVSGTSQISANPCRTVRRRNRQVLHERRSFRACKGRSSPQERLRSSKAICKLEVCFDVG